MVFKATINQSQVHVTLVHPNDPKNHCAESLYPFFFEFVEWSITIMIHGAERRVTFFYSDYSGSSVKKKTVQYKDKIYANFYRKFKLYFFKKTFRTK